MSDANLVAFRCRHCGHLEHAGHAGDLAVPLACRVCRRGIKFDPDTGARSANPDNWEVLAACDDARLAELGLTRAEVVAHAGTGGPKGGAELAAALSDGAGTTDG